MDEGETSVGVHAKPCVARRHPGSWEEDPHVAECGMQCRDINPTPHDKTNTVQQAPDCSLVMLKPVVAL